MLTPLHLRLRPRCPFVPGILGSLVVGGILGAAPVAVDDVYNVREDTVLNATGGRLFSADFESVSLDGEWDFLDRIENSLGNADPYPVDGQGRDWKEAEFDVNTSTVGPWSSGDTPMKSGLITPFPPGLPDVLFGIDEAPNGTDNLINTYLFRNTLTVDAPTAAVADWSIRVLADDGCVIYMNGSEIGRVNMAQGEYNPPGPLTTETLTNNSNETYTNLAVNLAGILTEGVNTIAVELHQSSFDSSDCGFDFAITPAGGGTGSFAFSDFATVGAQSTGMLATTGGFDGSAGLQVLVGGSSEAQPAIGGWQRSFDLSSAGTVTLTLRHRLVMDNDYEGDEFSELFVEVDGTRYGTGGEDYLSRFVGDGNGGDNPDSGWVTDTLGIPLSAGSHQLTLGVFNNKSTVSGETTQGWFDDVLVELPGGVLANDTGDQATLASALVSGTADGTLELRGDGTFTYTPDENFNGSDSFVYRATDSTGTSGDATVAIVVQPVNDPPVAVADAFSAIEETDLVVSAADGVLDNDTDIEDDPLTAVVVDAPAGGTVSMNLDGSFTYTPDTDFSGVDTFTYEAGDGNGSSPPATVTVTVANIDDPPVPMPDSYTTFENQPLVVSFASSGGAATMLVPAGSEWRYLDDGSDQGTAWIPSSFDDSTWATGAAQLGYGDDDETTVVDSGPNLANKFTTTYFRHQFQVTDPQSIGQLTLGLVRDDGVAVYLNGTEVVRDNLPEGAAYNTFALASVGGADESTFHQFSVNPIHLVEGTNVLAVEIHQFEPTSSDISFDLRLEAQAYAGLLANDSDPDGDTLSAHPFSDPPNGSVTVQTDGTFTYTPDNGFRGDDTFTYTASDGSFAVQQNVTVSVVRAGNTSPTAVADNYQTDEDLPLVVNAPDGILANDSDQELDSLVPRVTLQPASGALNVETNGAFVYVPDPDFFGDDFFVYVADDGLATSPPVMVSITVKSINDPPTPSDDSYEVAENGILEVTQTQPSGLGGMLDLVEQGATWRYLDDGSDQGTVWAETEFDDGSWAEGSAELGYGDDDEVTEVSYGPDENDKHITTYFRHTFNLTNVHLVTDLTLGVKRDDGVAVYLNGAEVFRENLDDNAGFDTVAAIADDDGVDFHEAGVDPGLLVDGDNVLAVEIHQGGPTSSDISFDLYFLAKLDDRVGVLANDTDIEGTPLVASVLTVPQNGNLSLNDDGTFTYTPNVNYEGDDSFVYVASDGDDGVIATATITVTPGPNDIPETQPDVYSVVEDNPLSVPALLGVLRNDSDPEQQPITTVLASDAATGSVNLSPDGSFTYQPDENFNGIDSFTYYAFDGLDNSRATTVQITVQPFNDAPTATADSYVVQPGGLIAPDAASGVLANDGDADADTINAFLVSDVSTGSLNLNPDGSFLYVAGAGFSGIETFTYKANDSIADSNTVTVTLRVNARPNATNDVRFFPEDTTLVVDAPGVLGNDSDAANEPLQSLLVSPPDQGVLNLNSDGSFSFTPPRNFSGVVPFTYTANDPFQSSLPATVSLFVTPVNDPPVATEDGYRVEPDGPTVIASAQGVLANDTDVENQALGALLGADVEFGTLELSANGAFTYTPGPGFAGSDTFTYKASDGSAESAEVTVTLSVVDPLDAIVINEIMYHPGSEDSAEEYIELQNIGNVALNLFGWRITKGVDFTFPDVTVPPDGFLVVAADTAAFEAAYGALPNVIGNWTGRLSNGGELIRLRDAANNLGDEVEYSDQGDWAQRVRIRLRGEDGWDWASDHDGNGASMELINPAVSNKSGQNWAPSIDAPTPGAPNSVASSDTAPLISKVRHDPPVPRSTDPVTITARLRDGENAILGCTLRYRESTMSPGPFIQVPMFDDGEHGDGDAGDGEFGAIVPPFSHRAVVEFYVLGNDGTNIRTWPAPTDVGQVANALYQHDDEAHDGAMAFYRLIMTAEEDEQFTNITRGSNAEMNTTLILDDCSNVEIRYLCGTRVRGAGSRSHTPAPRRVNIPADNPINGSTRMNLNPKFTYLQYIGMKLFHASGLQAPFTRIIQLRRNGVDETRDDGFDYGTFVHVEPLSAEFVDEKFRDDEDGNLYKKVRPDNNWAWRDGDVGDYLGDGWLKRTNSSENDWTDLDEFLRVMNQADGDPDYIDQVEAVGNVDQWMKWFATMTLLANGETNLATGTDDDYSMYRGVDDPRFVFVPHDLDTILSIGDGSAISNPQHTLFDMVGRGDSLTALEPLFAEPSIRQRYLTAMRELIQTTFSASQFNELLQNHLDGFVPQGVIDDMRDFMDARRSYALGEIENDLGPTPPPANATTTGTVSAGHGPLYINEVLALNASAHPVAGAFPDVLELFNAGATAIPLEGMTMSDDPADPGKFVFPNGASIGAGEYLLVYASPTLAAPGIYLGFQLDGDGEGVYLYESNQTLVDSIEFGIQVPDMSIGRTGVNAATWTLVPPSLGGANAAQALGDPNALRINEWMAQPELTFGSDFMELYNPDPLPVALGDLAITDDAVNFPRRHVLPPLSFIAGGGFLVFEAKGSAATPTNPTELPFKMDSVQGWLSIAGANGVEIDEIYYECHRFDLAQGRLPDGSATYADFVLPTPGVSNESDLTTESELIQSVRITELMYNPVGGPDLEYVELTNIGANPVGLGDIRFSEGIQFQFSDMTLNPGEHVLVVNNRATFETFYGNGFNIAGEYSGRLDNAGERVRLEIVSLGAGILDFEYDDGWYPSTDGGGYALVIVDSNAPRHDWNLKQNWRAGEIGGTPGEDDLIVEAGAGQTIILPAQAQLDGACFKGNLGQVTLEWTLESGPAPVQFGTPEQEDTSVTFSQPGAYVLLLTATASGKTSSDTVEVIVTESYDDWVIRRFGGPNAGVTDKLDDPDFDGIVNLLEYFFGKDPNVPSLPIEIEASIENGRLTLRYKQHFVSPDDVAILPEASNDLLSWQSAVGEVSTVLIGNDGALLEYRMQDLSPTQVERFMRLKVVATAP